MRRASICLMVLAVMVLACGRATGSPTVQAPRVDTISPASPLPPPAVPAEYQPIADELNAELGAFESTLPPQTSQAQSQVIIGTELAFANGNIADGLLNPSTLQRNLALLDRLQAMGVKGVVLQICYPLLDPSYPRSSEYLQFFKEMVGQVHAHGMKVLVESGAIFANTPYSPLQWDWSTYTTAGFLQGRENQVLLIAREVKPDYLMIGNEPTTEEQLTGLTITPDQWGNFISDMASKIDRSGGVLVGAGVGTWEDASFFTRVMQVPGLDFIDLHIYPMGKNASLLERALNYARQATAGGKRLTFSEAWLYKVSPQEGSSTYGNYAEAYDRDVYSFWEPLDARFIQDLVRLADSTHADFISFFWMRYFFTYLDYDSTPHGQSTQAINLQINQVCLSSVEAGSLSSLGQWFQGFLQARAVH